MVRELVLECTFLIPIRRDADLSDGRLHSTTAWNWLSDELYEQFGGRTVAPGLYQGVYKDPETRQTVRDKCRKFTVAVKRREVGRIRRLLAEACDRFRQKCIYLSVAGRVEFIEAREHG